MSLSKGLQRTREQIFTVFSCLWLMLERARVRKTMLVKNHSFCFWDSRSTAGWIQLVCMLVNHEHLSCKLRQVKRLDDRCKLWQWSVDWILESRCLFRGRTSYQLQLLLGFWRTCDCCTKFVKVWVVVQQALDICDELCFFLQRLVLEADLFVESMERVWSCHF